MHAHYLVVVLLFLSIGNMVADNGSDPERASSWQSYLLLEGNNFFPMGSINSDIAVRQKVNTSYSSYDNYGSVSPDAYGFAGGLQWMFYNSGLRIGVSSGLRYTNYMTEIYGYVSHNSDFFYLRYSEVDQETRFARVTSISETKEYLSIPLEVTYKAFEIERIGFWARLGGEFGVSSISHKTDISFREFVTDDFKASVLPSIGSPDKKALSKMYATLGATYHLKNDMAFRMDAVVFSRYLNNDTPFVLIKSDYFSGLMLSIQIPLDKK